MLFDQDVFGGDKVLCRINFQNMFNYIIKYISANDNIKEIDAMILYRKLIRWKNTNDKKLKKKKKRIDKLKNRLCNIAGMQCINVNDNQLILNLQNSIQYNPYDKCNNIGCIQADNSFIISTEDNNFNICNKCNTIYRTFGINVVDFDDEEKEIINNNMDID